MSSCVVTLFETRKREKRCQMGRISFRCWVVLRGWMCGGRRGGDWGARRGRIYAQFVRGRWVGMSRKRVLRFVLLRSI